MKCEDCNSLLILKKRSFLNAQEDYYNLSYFCNEYSETLKLNENVELTKCLPCAEKINHNTFSNFVTDVIDEELNK